MDIINKIDEYTIEEFKKYLYKLNYSIYDHCDVDLPEYNSFDIYEEIEKEDYLYDITLEEVMLFASTKYDDKTILDNQLEEFFDNTTNQIISILILENKNVNFDSVLLKNYKFDEEYAIYMGYTRDKDGYDLDIDRFNQFYSFDEKFNDNIDKMLTIYNYKLENHIELVPIEEEDCSHYERKHYKIKIFLDVWNIYKTMIEEKDKDRFFEKIIPRFKQLNWKTVSRLFDYSDKEFIEKFNKIIDWKFAKMYHPYYSKTSE